LTDKQRWDIVRYAVRHVSAGFSVSNEDLEDAESVVYLKIYETDVSNFPGYACQAARNYFRDLFRAQKRRSKHVVSSYEICGEDLKEKPIWTANTEEMFAGVELLESVERALEGINEDYRDAVFLHLKGLPLKDSAKALGIKFSTYKSRLYRGMAKVRQNLGPL